MILNKLLLLLSSILSLSLIVVAWLSYPRLIEIFVLKCEHENYKTIINKRTVIAGDKIRYYYQFEDGGVWSDVNYREEVLCVGKK